jgi:hypothetical protein
MAVSVVTFALTSAAYQDVSGGFGSCAFRLPFASQKNNIIRVHLGTSLPAAETANFDEYMAPQSEAEERQLHFYDMEATDRVYVRASRQPCSISVYRK